MKASPIKHVKVCGICGKSHDQHLLAHCDTCQQYYHLGCLTPPLTRMPKKSKQYGWSCSECYPGTRFCKNRNFSVFKQTFFAKKGKNVVKFKRYMYQQSY